MRSLTSAPMDPAVWIPVVCVVVLAWAIIARWLLYNPMGDVAGGLMWRFTRFYSWFMHRLRVEGKQHIPRLRDHGPVVVVANHTAGVDPVLIQAVCPFHVRWMMAEDMRHPMGTAFWEWCRIIFVDRDKGDPQATRVAMRHVTEGGVLGLFPEGGIERPAEHLKPFARGVGVIIKKTGARVLPIVVDGTPQIDPAWDSLKKFSRSRLRVMPPIDYAETDLKSAEIVEDLERRFREWTGWPMCGGDADEALVEEVESRRIEARPNRVAS